jgi:hypothetical protein
MLTKAHQLVLYSLGECYRQLNKRFEAAPLEVSVSKVLFIQMLIDAGLIGKKERALYKNLELLENLKFVSYSNKQLRFTQRGYTLFSKISKDLSPYLLHNDFWSSQDLGQKKLQLRFKNS